MQSEKALGELVTKLRDAAGENVTAVVLYGSAAGRASHAHADLNVLCLMRHLSGKELEVLRPPALWWWRKGYPAPLVFTLEELRNSADVFAIELLDMKARHRMLYGEDFFGELEIPMHLHRLQVEREFRTNVIRLRLSTQPAMTL